VLISTSDPRGREHGGGNKEGNRVSVSVPVHHMTRTTVAQIQRLLWPENILQYSIRVKCAYESARETINLSCNGCMYVHALLPNLIMWRDRGSTVHDYKSSDSYYTRSHALMLYNNATEFMDKSPPVSHSMYVRRHSYMYVCMYVCMSVCMYVCVYVCMYTILTA